MKQSDFTGLVPANEVLTDDRQGSLLIGFDLSSTKDITGVGRLHKDGSYELIEAIERGGQPKTLAGVLLFSRAGCT